MAKPECEGSFQRDLHVAAAFFTCLHRGQIPNIISGNRPVEVRFIGVLDTSKRLTSRVFGGLGVPRTNYIVGKCQKRRIWKKRVELTENRATFGEKHKSGY